MPSHTAPESRGPSSLSLTRRAILRHAAAATVFLPLSGRAARAAATTLTLWPGNRLASFTLPDTTGRDLALASQRGKITLVHFFATWCEPCREELPALRRLSERAGERLSLLAISVAEPDSRVQRFLEKIPLPFPVLLDRERRTAKAWNVITLPTTIVLDAELRPRLFVDTDFAWDTLDPMQLETKFRTNNKSNS